MARSGCIVKALMVFGFLAGVIGEGKAAQAQAPAQPAPTTPPRSAAAPTPAPSQPPAAEAPKAQAPAAAPAPRPKHAPAKPPKQDAPTAQAPAAEAPAVAEPAPAASAQVEVPSAVVTAPPAATSGEPVDAGTVAAPVVQPPQAIPAPPPDHFAFPHQHPVEACPPGRCGWDCQHRCRGHRMCTNDGRCEDEWRDEEPGQEHKGLLLRVTTGWGFGQLSASKHDLHEPSFVLGLGVDVGAAVIENLIVRGRVRGSAGYYSEGDFGDDVLFTFGGIGAGVDYYFMPINMYVGATISVAGIARADEDDSNRSKAGIGLDFDLGKEWWVGRRWGIGLALRASYIDVGSANIVHDPSARLRSFHVGLQMSATFN